MAEHRATKEAPQIAVDARTPICIIGVGVRLPGGHDSAKEFYEALLGGLDAMAPIPPERWDAHSLDDPRRMFGTVKGIDEFDAQFFSIPPVEAARIDPQHRILLEASVHAIQDSGSRLADVAATRTGVFIGCSSQEYAVTQIGPGGYTEISGQTNPGVALSIASNRVSYHFDLRGPSMTVDTACSSSLLAVHLAVSAMRRGECTMALAGGVNALLGPGTTIGFARGGFLSDDGHCKAFDASADGFARSEGAAVLVLKPLPAALRDGDRIYATIVGTATNEDGLSDGGMSHPSQRAQREVITAALRDANALPSAIQYVEAHGTGTPVGDPIEVSALGEVIGTTPGRQAPLVIGSVKTQIGHLEPASGAAGLVKLALSMYHRMIPGNLHFKKPNPAIAFEELGVRVAVGPTPWPADKEAHIFAGINSFGFGGANVHAVLCGPPSTASMEAVVGPTETPHSSVNVLRISARSGKSLAASASQYAALLRADKHSLASICNAAATTRDGLELRAAILAHNPSEAVSRLEALATAGDSVKEGTERGRKPDGRAVKVAFVCSGQGPQWARMTTQLMSEEPVFASVLRRVDVELGKLRPGWSLLSELSRPAVESRMGDTYVAQPALMAVQIALAELWRSRGVVPDAVVGHSVGEVAATHIAGALTLEQACFVIHHRSRVQAKAAGSGRMLAVGMGESEARALLPEDGSVSIAACNAPSATTLSGDAEQLSLIARQLEQRRIFCRFLRVDTPFHSRVMDPLREDLVTALSGLKPSKCTPGIELWSTVTGERAEGTHAGAEHWFANVRGAVMFESAVRGMLKTNCNAFVELSPHPALSTAVSETIKAAHSDAIVVTSMRNGDNACQSTELARAEARLFCWGHDCSLAPRESEKRLPLPLYSWDREKFWNENVESAKRRRGSSKHPHLRESYTSLREPGNVVVELLLDTARDHTYLRDHAINGQIVLPAAAHTDIALSVGRQLFGESFCFIEDVHFAKAMFLPAQARIDISSDRGCFYTYSRPPLGSQSTEAQSGGEWTLNSYGRINTLQDAFEPRRSEWTLDRVCSVCNELGDAEGLYNSLYSVGLELGHTFRCLRDVWVGPDRQCLARIALPHALATDPRHARFSLHPSMMDASLIAMFAPLEWESSMGGFLPDAVMRAWADPRAGGSSELWAHGVIVSSEKEYIIADIRFMLPSGDVVAELQGFRLKLIPGSSDKMSLASRGSFYHWSWRNQASQNIVPDQPKTKDRALIVSDADECDPAVIAVAELFNTDVLCKMTCEVEKRLQTLAGYSAVFLVLKASGSEVVEELEEKSSLLLALGHALTATPRTQSPRAMFVITRGSQQTAANEAVPGVAQAGLWGMARSIWMEATSATGTNIALVDLPHSPSVSDISVLCSHVMSLLSNGENSWLPEVAVRSGSLFAHILRREERRDTEGKVSLPAFGGEYIVSMPPRGGAVLKSLRLEHAPRRSGTPARSVVIGIRASSLNFRDVMCAAGMLPADALQGSAWEYALGCECSGVVTAVGEGSRFSVGDEVISWTKHCLGGSVVASDDVVRLKPAWATFEEAAVLTVVYVTAYYALHYQCRMRRGEWLLLHSAAGGVGVAAINLARAAGIKVIATASRRKHDYLRSLGVEHVFDSSSLTFRDEVMRVTKGRGVDAVLNSLSGKAIAQSARCLAPFGRFAEIGKTDIYRDSKLSLRLMAENCSYFAIDIDKMTAQRPELTATLVDESLAIVSDLQARGQLVRHELNVFPISRTNDAFVALAGGKILGKAVVSTSLEDTVLADPSEAGPLLDSHGIYIVTGGTSGLGLQTAQWLANRGAGRLLLVSRSGKPRGESKRDLETLNELVKSGKASSVACDVSKIEEVTNMIDQICKADTGFVLRGVFHAAAIFDDCPLAKTTPQSMATVSGPKAIGAWNLHMATTAVSTLEHFVVFSSIASVIGNAGQVNYTFANAFLDGLAHHREALGLPASVVNWGPIAARGYLARPGAGGRRVLELLAAKGWTALTPAQTESILERVLRHSKSEDPQLVAAIVDWERFSSIYPVQSDPRFSLLMAKASSSPSTQESSGSVREAIFEATGADREHLLRQHLQKGVAKITGAQVPENIDSEASLQRLGLDSLMTNQLQSLIFADLGIDVPLMRLVRGPSITTLAKELSAELQILIASSSPPSAATPSPSFTTGPPSPGVHRAEADQQQWFSCAGAVKKPRLRLVCFPYHLGGPSAFASWAEELPQDIEMHVVRVPGWESRESESAPADLASLIAPLVGASRNIIASKDNVPYAIYGHSLGAIIAYEFARATSSVPGARSPARFFAAACPAPDWFKGKPFSGAFSVGGESSSGSTGGYEPPAPHDSVLPCGISAIAAEEDEVFGKDLSAGWSAVAGQGEFEKIEIAGAKHLFLNNAGLGDSRSVSASSTALQTVLRCFMK